MFIKIALTLAVIISAFLYIQKQRSSTVAPKRPQSQQQPQNRVITQIAIIIVASMALSSVALIYYEYSKNQRIVNVHIINTHTGKKSSYKARRGEISGRSFISINGKTVFLAETERMELESLN